MKPVFINFTDSKGKNIKTFSTCSLKTGMMDNIFDIAERAEQYENGTLGIKEGREFFKDLKSLITNVFKGQFTYDELNENVEQKEILRVFNDLCSRISGEMSKN